MKTRKILAGNFAVIVLLMLAMAVYAQDNKPLKLLPAPGNMHGIQRWALSSSTIPEDYRNK